MATPGGPPRLWGDGQADSGEGPAVVRPLELAGATVLAGTCSWTDPTLTRETQWYPKKSMSAGDRLRFYAAHFPLVEVDSTYYRPPSPEVARGWAERVPPGFCFDVKAYGLLTGHPVDVATLWPDIRAELPAELAGKKRAYAHHLPAAAVEEAWARFAAALGPLAAAGRFGAVLLQYPTWFVPKKANREELSRVRERLGGLPACAEFRSPKWLAEGEISRTLGLLRDLGLAFVVVDAPAVSGLPTIVEATTEELAVVRFHGRADATWAARNVTAAERFRYLYSEAELAEWAPRAKQLAQRAQRVHLLMNNCYRDYGTRNAAQLAALLAEDEARERA